MLAVVLKQYIKNLLDCTLGFLYRTDNPSCQSFSMVKGDVRCVDNVLCDRRLETIMKCAQLIARAWDCGVKKSVSLRCPLAHWKTF